MNNTKINIHDVAYVAYEATDLDLMENFLLDFGMTRSVKTDDSLYMRGSGSNHHCHVTRLGKENKFLGGAFAVATREELEKASKISGAVGPEEITDPGGGWRVTLTTPNKHKIWIEWGVSKVKEMPVRRSYRMNFASEHLRHNSAVRQRAEATPVLRIGHFVLWVPDAKPEIDWFMDNFAMAPADYICAHDGPPGKETVVGTFLRIDKGKEYVEHHCILINQSIHYGCHHSSFEVLDLDAVTAGHDHLVSKGWQLDAGVGRHYLGSLIYDYWLDPFGNRIEHYTDTDMINDEYVPVRFVGTADETTQWGMAPPPTFFE